MKLFNLLAGSVFLMFSVPVHAATIVFSPTDGNINVLLDDLGGGTLAIFDDSDTGFSGPYLEIDVPSVASFSGPVGMDYTVTNSTFDSLTLTGSANFLLALDSGSGWMMPTAVTPLGASAYTVSFDEASVLITDISAATIPVPAAAWLFASGLIGLVGVARRSRT